MTSAETLRVLLFLTAVGTVYALAALIALRWAIRRWLRRGPEPGRRERIVGRVILGLAGVGVLCIVYGRLVEPFWPEVTRSRITSARLPQGSRPIRIVHLSDLHCDPTPRLEERLPALIAAEKPDLIVFSGDSMNSPDALPVLKSCLTQLAAVAPTFVVRGNWDTASWRKQPIFDGTGCRELDGTVEKIDVGGVPVWIAGVAADSELQAGRALAGIPPGALTLFLYHYPYPDVVPAADQARVDLLCSGHVHGGQVALPFYGALVTLSKYGKQYEAGLYRAGPMWMYVSRGIGMEGSRAPRVRFCSRPEIAVIDVAPE